MNILSAIKKSLLPCKVGGFPATLTESGNLVTKLQTTMQKKYSNIITDFLRAHPLISVDGLEKELDLPAKTIWQAMTGSRDIPAKHIFSIVCHLAGYGLKIDGYTLTFDQADSTLTGRKFLEEIGDEESEGGFVYVVKESRMLATDYSDLF